MTALDQALIKAYVRRGTGPETGATEAHRPAVPLSQALAELSGPRSASMSIDSLLDDSPVPHSHSAARAATQPIEPSVATMPKARAVSELPTVADFFHAATTRTASIHTESARSIQPTESIDATPQVEQYEPVDVEPASPRVPDWQSENTYRADPAESNAAYGPAAGIAVPPPHLAMNVDEPQQQQESAVAPWRPMLQVDHCVWPETWSRLQTTAVRQMDQMTEGLTAIVRSGQKVLGFGSCSSGEGITTMVLAAGRRLALQGLRVALVDANLANPQIAASLGLLPQVGWEETLAGRMPLEEVLIESIADHLAVLPVRESFDNPNSAATDESRIAETLDTLAENYDAVLIDLGPLEDPATANGLLGRGLRQRLDAIVLVHSVRTTTPDRLTDLQNNLAAANIAHAGTIQNFVAR